MAKVNEVKQHIEPVTIELGGKVRRLQFDMNAFAEMEKLYGSIDEAMDSMQKGKLSDIRNILWAGLIHEEVKGFDETSGEPIGYNITPYSVGAMITSPAMLPEISAKLAKAFGASLSAEDIEAAMKAGEEAAGNLLKK